MLKLSSSIFHTIRCSYNDLMVVGIFSDISGEVLGPDLVTRIGKKRQERRQKGRSSQR